MAEEQLDRSQVKEILRFQMTYNKRQIKATWVLSVIIVGLFLLEEWFGGSQNIAVLVRMGANVSARVREGEYYRLLSSVFLHAGFLHVFFNTYVLFALGGFFNRILGESRYLTVFLVSGITGSLASVFFGKSAVSVGASGAIWGLFGASLALAFFKTSLVPEPIRLQLRRVTFINLIINLGISFLPMIDFWAHIGGGLGGFLISLLIIFRPEDRSIYRWISYCFRTVALSLSALYIASIIYGMWTYKPWENQLTTDLVSVDLKEIPYAIMVPTGLTESLPANNTDGSASYVFGNPQLDRIIVEFHFFKQAMLGLTSDSSQNWLHKQRDELLSSSSVPADVKKSIYFRETPDGGVLYYQQMPKNTDMTVHNYVITRGEYAIKLGLMVSENAKRNDVDAIANRMIEGIRKK